MHESKCGDDVVFWGRRMRFVMVDSRPLMFDSRGWPDSSAKSPHMFGDTTKPELPPLEGANLEDKEILQ